MNSFCGGDGDGDWICGGGRCLFLLFLLALGLRLSCSALDFSSRGGFLYLGAFTKVVSFDDMMAAATIRAYQDGPAV